MASHPAHSLSRVTLILQRSFSPVRDNWIKSKTFLTSSNGVKIALTLLKSYTTLSTTTHNSSPSKETVLKKLPISIQKIEDIIQKGYVYVDKTDYAQQLIENGKCYFLNRPRRFGKSLFLSTLKAILEGNRELFKSYKIGQSHYQWKKHIVIHLDFSNLDNRTTKGLEESLHDTVNRLARIHKIRLESLSLPVKFVQVVEDIARKENKPVALLIDEYDKPLTDRVHDIQTFNTNRELLKIFLGTLKSLDSVLKFVFVTGVFKFAQFSLFSGANHLQDISFSPNHATMLGYTEKEIKSYFGAHIEHLIETKKSEGEKISSTEILNEIRDWYNGYRFSSKDSTVYNPHSTLSFLNTGFFDNYWISTGTPTLLMERNIEDVSLKLLMFQSGYLTIRSYNPQTQIYTLDFPNQEVRYSFFESMIEKFLKISPTEIQEDGLECKE
eukprot:gene1975-2430_t